jgi:hypothetical protein
MTPLSLLGGEIDSAVPEGDVRASRCFDGNIPGQDVEICPAHLGKLLFDMRQSLASLPQPGVFWVALLSFEAHGAPVASSRVGVLIKCPATVPGESDEQRPKRAIVVVRCVKQALNFTSNLGQVAPLREWFRALALCFAASPMSVH